MSQHQGYVQYLKANGGHPEEVNRRCGFHMVFQEVGRRREFDESGVNFHFINQIGIYEKECRCERKKRDSVFAAWRRGRVDYDSRAEPNSMERRFTRPIRPMDGVRLCREPKGSDSWHASRLKPRMHSVS